MSSAMMMERTGLAVPGMAGPAVGAGVTPAGVNMMMVPRGTFKFEKVSGGVKVTCVCDDKTACGMMQNLCTMLAGGMVSCCCVLNGVVVCCCNFTMGLCKCEMTSSGVCVTCTSGDSKCCEMIQSCCDCVCQMTKCGCTCCLMMNGTPVCCGGC
jgi:hypothetical protein